MALSVTSNFAISAGYASNNMRNSQTLMGKSINRISSGHRAANPADDITSYMSGTKLKSDAKGYTVLSTGVQGAAAKLNMADSALSDVNNALLDLKSQAIALSATSDTDEQNQIKASMTDTLTVLKSMSTAPQYKGSAVFNPSSALNVVYGFSSSVAFPVATSTLQFPTAITNLNASSTSLAIQAAIDGVTAKRVAIGGSISALEQISNYLSDMAASADAAYTAVTEVDMAREMTSYVKNNIQSQAAQAMVSQANQSLAQVLNLLQV